MKRVVPRPSPGVVLGSVALFLALTGTSAADVAQIARNSVGTVHIKNNAVTTPKIRNSAVTTPKIRNGAITLEKLAPNARVAGPQGPAGPAGPAGPQGPPGAPVNVADGSITTAKLASNAVTNTKLAANSVESAQIRTRQIRGRHLEFVQAVNVQAAIAANSSALALATCPGETRLLTGGGSANNPAGNRLVQSFPIGNSWRVVFYNQSASAGTIVATAYCLP
ncbi:MAG: hypothetical protein R6W48_04230 [Gaiellaceae bacterium]